MNRKRVQAGAVILFSLAALASAQSITLLKPNSGGNFALGSTAPIVWSYTGIPETATVRVVLLRNGAKVGVIHPGLPIQDKALGKGYGGMLPIWKAGDYSGGTAQPGCGYAIRLVVNNSGAKDESDVPFCIAGPAQSVFRIDSPLGGETWGLNSTARIAWTSTGYSGQLLIKLWKGGLEWGAIHPGIAATAGSFDWKVGESPKYHDFVGGSDYSISIEPVTKVAGGPVTIHSKVFSISVPLNFRRDPKAIGQLVDHPIQIFQPASGGVIWLNKKVKVTWTGPAPSTPVSIGFRWPVTSNYGWGHFAEVANLPTNPGSCEFYPPIVFTPNMWQYNAHCEARIVVRAGSFTEGPHYGEDKGDAVYQWQTEVPVCFMVPYVRIANVPPDSVFRAGDPLTVRFEKVGLASPQLEISLYQYASGKRYNVHAWQISGDWLAIVLPNDGLLTGQKYFLEVKPAGEHNPGGFDRVAVQIKPW